MTPLFVLPETVVRDDGHGPEIALEASTGRALMLTLGITRVLERETLEVAIQGSRDRLDLAALGRVSQEILLRNLFLAGGSSQPARDAPPADPVEREPLGQCHAKASVSRFLFRAKQLRARVAGAA